MNSACVQHCLVVQLKAELMPLLHEALTVLEEQLPSVRSSVFAYPTGSATSFQGFIFGVSCVLSGVPDSDLDNVSLVVCACYLNEHPRLNADVTWGNGHVEADLSHGASSSEHWPVATSERYSEVRTELPRLISVLGQAALRGRP
jgi:hypothetical protein